MAVIAGKVTKKVGQKRKKGASPVEKLKKKAVEQVASGDVAQAVPRQLQKKQRDLSPAQRLQLRKGLHDLETEFSQHLARIYNKGAHKSGVQGCHALIDDHCVAPDNMKNMDAAIATEFHQSTVGIFLKALSNKNLLQVAKSASAGSFQFLQFHASLFGYLALKFRTNMTDCIRDVPPSLVKTVKRVIHDMKELFF